MDSYYNFIPYGFLIHSAKDRFSREILWGLDILHKKNPKYATRLYNKYKHIKQIRRIPRMIRRETGTEISHVKDIPVLLRYQYDDKVAGSRSFSVCRSYANQLKAPLWSCVMRISVERSSRCDNILSCQLRPSWLYI